MIIDKLENLKDYVKDQKLLDSIFNFLKSADSVSVGKHDIYDGTYANVLEYVTKPFVEVKTEAHVKYVDLQYVVCEREKVLYADKGNNSPINEYNDVKDVIHYAPSSYTEHIINSGEFGIMYPDDLHQCVAVSEPIQIKKIVVKIPVGKI